MDVEVMLAQIEADRTEGNFGFREEVLEWVLQVVESREQLDRLFVPLGDHGFEVADRVDEFLRFGDAVVERTDEELVELAQAHLVALRDLATSGTEVREGAVGLIEAFLDLGVEVADGVGDDALALNGFGEQPTFDVLVPEPFGVEHAHRLAGLDGILIDRNAAELPTRVEHAEMESIFNSLALRDYPHLRRWLMAPALADDGLVFDVGPWFRLWEAGTTLWATPAGVRVVRGEAKRFAFEAYRPERSPLAPAVVGEARARWMETAGAGAKRALELVDRCAVEAADALVLDGLGLPSLPPGLEDLRHVEHLSVADNEFDSFPVEIAGLSFLGGLNVAGCGLSELPDDLAEAMPMLWTLSAERNMLATLPASLCSMTALRHLRVGQNQLQLVPSEIGELINLERASLDKNQITKIPVSISNLQNLEFLSFTDCPLESLPPEILTLPDSTRLGLNCATLPDAIRFADNRAELRAAWPTEWGPLPT